jgi:tRNA nucleotidyltransferase (CCA-adding enzyme)
MNKHDQKGIAGKVLEKALRKVTPGLIEKEKTLKFSKGLADDLTEKLRKAGIIAKVNVQGSVAKDTWLAGDKDIDMFICVSKNETKEIFQRVLDVVKSFVGKGWVEAYAEHPYIEAAVKKYKVDFVPCFKVERAEEAGSSVDRTPLHTAYVNGRLDEQTKGEVRLFKRFVQGIGVYGAEIKVKGFSGYLCELLISFYGSFNKTLQGIVSWRFCQVVDIENFYEGRVGEARSRFNAPLIVIDPVDSGRNVAAAVSKTSFGELIMASKLFLDKPAYSFFYPKKEKPLSGDDLKERLEGLGFDLVFVVFSCSKACPDVLWGELHKTMHALGRLLSENDFQVLRQDVWSDERDTSVLIFGLETEVISPARTHNGPPVDSREAVNFVEEYTKSRKGNIVVAGPWVEEDRWVVVVKRRFVDAATLLRKSFRSSIDSIGIANELTDNVREAKVYVNVEILNFYSSSEEFARFLTEFLRGRPKWLG